MTVWAQQLLPMTAILKWSLRIGSIAFAVAAVGCGEDDPGSSPSGEEVGNSGEVVGGACGSDQCAVGSYCETSGSFPDGLCTRGCASHGDCPSGTRCISNQSGICLLSCSATADCRAGYRCDEESDETGGGSSCVCTD